MVFRLRIDVYDRLVLLRDAHAKCSIALLPLKSRLDVFIEPFGGAAFQELHGLRQRHSCGKRKKNVNVVVRATDRDGFEAVSARNAAEERPEAVSNLFVDYGQSFFLVENTTCMSCETYVCDIKFSAVPTGLPRCCAARR